MVHTELAAARTVQPRGVTSRKNHRVWPDARYAAEADVD
jgi:hypothetical protein